MEVDAIVALDAIQGAARKLGMQTQELASDAHASEPRLWVLPGLKLKGENLGCELMVLPDTPEPPVLQFLITLPMKVPQEMYGDMARLLLQLNVAMPMGGFGMIEGNSLVFFRTLLPFTPEALNLDLIMECLHITSACVASVGDLVIDLSQQNHPPDVIREQARKRLQG